MENQTNWTNILSQILQVAFLGLSIYGATNPKASWIGPVVTGLAGVTRTPQTAINEGLTKSVIFALTVGFGLLATAKMLWL